MRSSKSRSRSKSNRPRSIGNIINRVFDSSGPEGKVRGTPQQIIEKYQFLARDAQLSNDRVAAENFMQHAEHYTRMLAEAQRELAAEQDQRRPQDFAPNGGQNGNQNGQNNQNGGQGNPQNGNQGYNQGGGQGYNQGGGQNQSRDNQNRDNQGRDNQNRDNQNRDNQGRDSQNRDNQNRDRYRDDRAEPRIDPRDEQPDLAPVRSASMMDFIDEISDTGLVETPETRRTETARPEFTDRRQPKGEPQDRRTDDRKPQQERPRAAKPMPQPPAESVAEATVPAGDAVAAPRRARAPRKPRVEPSGEGGSGPAEAAE